MKLTGGYPLPQQLQIRNYAKALERPCPVCNAKAGEPCMPSSLQIPHLKRCRDENGKDAA